MLKINQTKLVQIHNLNGLKLKIKGVLTRTVFQWQMDEISGTHEQARALIISASTTGSLFLACSRTLRNCVLKYYPSSSPLKIWTLLTCWKGSSAVSWNTHPDGGYWVKIWASTQEGQKKASCSYLPKAWGTFTIKSAAELCLCSLTCLFRSISWYVRLELQ